MRFDTTQLMVLHFSMLKLTLVRAYSSTHILAVVSHDNVFTKSGRLRERKIRK